MNSAGIEWGKYYRSGKLNWFELDGMDLLYFERLIDDSELIKAVLKEVSTNTNNYEILEAGCGTGSIAICLSLSNFNVTAFDYNYEALKIVKILQNKLNIEFKTYIDDLLKITDTSKKYNLIYNQAVLEYFSTSDIRKIIYQLNKILKPNGKILFIVQNTSHPFNKQFNNQPMVYPFNLDQLKIIFHKIGYKIERCEGLYTSKVLTNLILSTIANDNIRYILYRILRKIPKPPILKLKLGSQILITASREY